MSQQEQVFSTSDETMVGRTPGQTAEETADRPEVIVEHGAPTVSTERPGSKPASKKATDPCGLCGAEQSAIRINVDGNTLLMESCDNCDVRRWQLAGERIDLQEALNQVGEHSGRRRPRA